MANIRTLKLNLLADTSDFAHGIKKASAQTDSFSKKIAKDMKVAAVAVGTLAIAFGVSAVKAAAADQKSQKQLALALQKTTKASKAQLQATEAWITKTQFATGVADDELRPALAKLVRVTGSVKKGQDLLSLALDVSAGSGKDLSTVTGILTRAQEGNLSGLKKLGVPLSDTIVKNKDLKAALKQTASLFGGAAKTNAQTFSGKLEILKQRMNEAKESIGTSILTALQPLADEWLPKISTGVTHFVDGLTGQNGMKSAAHDGQQAVFKMGQEVRNFFKYLSDHKQFLKDMAIIIGSIFIGAKAGAAVSAMITAVKLLVPAFEAVTTAAGLTAGAEAAATGGSSLLVAAPAIASIAAAFGISALLGMWDGTPGNPNAIPLDSSGHYDPNSQYASSGEVTTSTYDPSHPYVPGSPSQISLKVAQNKDGVMVTWDPKAKKWFIANIDGTYDYSVAQPPPPKALGGIVNRGMSYLVGEHGPELFTPNGGGVITPNGRMGSGTTIINLNGIVDGESARRAIERLMRESSIRTGAVSFVGRTV
jgi:hypothetical protein